jgi:hypothetical protein
LESGEGQEADYVSVATGSSYARRFKPLTASVCDFRVEIAAAHPASRCH